MLVAAQIYREELQKKLQATWYDMKYQYFWQGGCEDIEIPNNNYWKKQFVFLDKGYKKLIKKFGGKQVGKLTQNTRLLDGKLHDTVFYEIFREDYLKKGRREANE